MLVYLRLHFLAFHEAISMIQQKNFCIGRSNVSIKFTFNLACAIMFLASVIKIIFQKCAFINYPVVFDRDEKR